jgi:spoIIIJ-associated protein
MTAAESAKKILDTMLGHLGFTATLEIQQTDDGPAIQVMTNESELLIGKDGDRLDDFQYLVNRILRRHIPKAERVKVDCEHFRSMQEDKLNTEVRGIAERVRATGKAFRMRPLNAYYRRLVYNALLNEPDIESHSPEGDDRLKRIVIQLKTPPTQPA